jgi:YidC/Oxa1 family membrane protein insertase
MPEPSGNPNDPKPELSMEKRMFLFFALTMLVFLVFQYFYKPAPAPAPVIPTKSAASTSTPGPVAGAANSAAAVSASPTSAAPMAAASETTTVIDTDVYHVVFTNRGAMVKSWVLKKYRDSEGRPLELVNAAATGLPGPLAIDLKDQKTGVADPNTNLYVATPVTEGSTEGKGVTFDFSDGKTTIRKSVFFGATPYLSEVHSEVLYNGTPIPHLLIWRGGFGDETVRNASGQQHTVHFETASAKLKNRNAKDAKDGPVSDLGDYAFGGVEDNFFAAVAIPAQPASLEVRTYDDQLTPKGEEKPQPFVGFGASTGVQNQFALFVGPKDLDLMRKVSPKLEQLVDWGFFGIIAKPLFLALNWVNDHWTNNFGWAIIVVTTIINLLLLPLRLTSLRSARKMQKLQPKIKEINDRYKGIGMRDPRANEKNQEVMALYKQEGINPVGGCLPLIIQLPFFYAFYRVLSVSIELRGASWFWVPDLSRPESLAIHLLPIILIATQFLTQRLTPTAGVDPNQQKMMMFMPLMFGFMFYYAASGLVLYWLTGNVVGIFQQLVINRFMPLPVPPAPPAKAAAGKAPVKRVSSKSTK